MSRNIESFEHEFKHEKFLNIFLILEINRIISLIKLYISRQNDLQSII